MSTKSRAPWSLVFSTGFVTRSDTRSREKKEPHFLWWRN